MRNPVGLENLETWLKKQNPRKTYCYGNSGTCLLHQFYAAMGMPIQKMFSDCWHDLGDIEHPLNETLNNIASCPNHTFGGALERTQEALEWQKTS